MMSYARVLRVTNDNITAVCTLIDGILSCHACSRMKNLPLCVTRRLCDTVSSLPSEAMGQLQGHKAGRMPFYSAEKLTSSNSDTTKFAFDLQTSCTLTPGTGGRVNFHCLEPARLAHTATTSCSSCVDARGDQAETTASCHAGASQGPKSPL